MNIGKTIADYRKAANMTQSEVADQLGVTYQAVSKWERDESLPDITLLPKIADLFHISIDTLLRGGFEIHEEQEVATAVKIIEEASNSNEPKEETEEKETSQAKNNAFINIDLSGLLERLAPLMKPNQLDRVVRKLDKVNKRISGIYPFLKNERMNELIEKMPSNGVYVNY